MTNVKLKLMFFLLNALLIVQARPYSDNTTDIVIKFNTTDNFKPVETNSDTLIVANEDSDTPEEINEQSNTHMEDIMNAEMDRDEDLSKKVMKESKENKEEIREKFESANETAPLNRQMEAIMNGERNRDVDISKKTFYPKNVDTESEIVVDIAAPDVTGLEKQMNTSSPLLDSIIDSDNGREETLTDILHPASSKFVDSMMPRFEFLIAGRVNESDNLNGSKSEMSLNSLDRNSSDVLRKVDYVELVEVGRPKTSANNSALMFVNITANEIDNDLAPDTIVSMFSGFSDMQTLFLACFATLLPLLGVLFATLLIRCMCRRWCPGFCSKPSQSSLSVSSEKQDSHHQQLKSPADESTGDVLEDDHPANGSIFTMTLKNNCLIVETEERNDIAKNGRETKMKYSPDNDGIFVVEVQQSTAYRPTNKPLQNSPPHDPQISTNQALIHRVPEELDRKIDEDSEKSSGKFPEKALALSSTGLSISDLSMSSIGSHNVSYSYGSQLGYEQGPFGYPIYSGYDVTKDNKDTNGIIYDNSQEPLISKTPTDPDRPVITGAIFKQDSIIGNDALQGPTYCIEGSTDGPLLSDVQAREFSLHHFLEKKHENGVAVPVPEKIESPKKALNRADSLPVRLEAEKPAEVTEAVPDGKMIMETIKENEIKDELPSKDMLKGKRASLPIIRTEMYESVKDAIRPSGSPKFEKFTNDSSPGEAFDAPPMITITEEIDIKVDDDAS